MTKTRSNASLLEAIDNIISSKFSEFSKSRSDEVAALVELNKKLIEQNRELIRRVDSLEKQTAVAVAGKNVDASTPEPVGTSTSGATSARTKPSKHETRTHVPCLVLSDSMLRHVSVAAGTKKVVIPGARCVDFFLTR